MTDKRKRVRARAVLVGFERAVREMAALLFRS